MLSNLDLVDDCDSFPYADNDPRAYSALLGSLYTLVTSDGTPIGYLTDAVLNALIRVPTKLKGELEVSRAKRTVCAFDTVSADPQTSTSSSELAAATPASDVPTLDAEAQRSALVAATAAYWREKKTFKVLDGWRDELYPVYDSRNQLLFSMERSASALFGIVTYGVHMTGFVRDETSSHGLKIWVPRRAKTKQTYGGMLDNTVAGGMATGEDPFECLVREAEEEASLPADFVRANAVAAGTVTYVHVRDARAGGETGLIQPECQYVYDLEMPSSLVPRPNDSEVEEFYLWTVEEVQASLAKGEFKPNCALLTLDFFIRHGVISEENERDYHEIKRRIHRDLEFPGPHKK